MLKYWYLKLLALILAVLLWFAAWGLASGTKEIKGVPIEAKNLRASLAYSLDNYEVDLKIAAKNSTLDKLGASDFKAVVDLNDWQKGTYQTGIELKNPSGVEIISALPDNLMVRIEDREEKEVKVEAIIEGVPAEDYLVGSIKLEPEKVIASGPKSEIDKLNKANVLIKLDGEKDGFGRELGAVAFDSQNKEIRSISSTPQKVKTNVSIFSGTNNKAVGIKPKIIGAPLAGFWLSNAMTEPSTIIINGEGDKLEKTDSIETAPFDLTGLKKSQDVKIALVFPLGVASVENIKEVTLHLELSSLETTRELYASIGFINTKDGHRVSRLSPQTINVVISGPLSQIRSLTSSQVALLVDLAGKDAGTFRIELSKDNIKAPAGIGVVSLLPNVVEVTIE